LLTLCSIFKLELTVTCAVGWRVVTRVDSGKEWRGLKYAAEWSVAFVSDALVRVLVNLGEVRPFLLHFGEEVREGHIGLIAQQHNAP
jgi:hypothetical protein